MHHLKKYQKTQQLCRCDHFERKERSIIGNLRTADKEGDNYEYDGKRKSSGNDLWRKAGEIIFQNRASGLSQVEADRLFDRFYTVENAKGSTGLGLSIAKLLTEKMGGMGKVKSLHHPPLEREMTARDTPENAPRFWQQLLRYHTK